MVLSANRVAWSAVVVARVVLELAVGATSVVKATSEVAAGSAEVAVAAVSPFQLSRTGRPQLSQVAPVVVPLRDCTWLRLRRF